MSLIGVERSSHHVWPQVPGWRALFSATLVGLAWFPLKLVAILVVNTIGTSLVLHTRHPTATQFEALTIYSDLFMLLASGVFCFLFIPRIFHIRRQSYRMFLREIGVLGGVKRAVVASVALLVLVIVFLLILAPPLFWQVDVLSWISLAQPPLVEEVLFRGIVLSLLLRRFPAWFAVVWAGLLFMPPHVFEGLVLMIGNGFVFGGLQGFLRLRTQSIWPGIAAHFLFVSGLGTPVFLAYVVVLIGFLVEWGVQALRKRKLRVLGEGKVLVLLL